MKLRLFNQEDLDLVQLQVLTEDEKPASFSMDAMYLESPVFSVFKSCFELSNTDYRYQENIHFDRDQIVSLRHHLLTHLTRLSTVEGSDDLELFSLRNINGIEFMNALKTCQPDWALSWEKIKDNLIIINKELIEMIDACIDDDKVMWIKEY